ncbi:MAG: DNA-3-methyladenine glycosylase I [Deltaproteobacteria bacterium]|jgi:DNA-3-methyladenine glycosylase I|nr:DNA-3-methyladenine glycosylase I [Deltaproteobacteria bacterium]
MADARKTKPPPWPPDGLPRCPWATADSLYLSYHDNVWGRPCRDDGFLFRMLILEGMQAGLSWHLVLKKEKAIVEAFEGLDPQRMASFGPAKVSELLLDPGIIRNRLKIEAAISNARACLELAGKEGSLSGFLWSFVQNEPIVNDRRTMGDVPPTTGISDAMSLELRKRGFKFVGSTIMYSLMQAAGLVNDHLRDCAFRLGDPKK